MKSLGEDKIELQSCQALRELSANDTIRAEIQLNLGGTTNARFVLKIGWRAFLFGGENETCWDE